MSHADYVRKRREDVLKYTLEGYSSTEIALALKEQYPDITEEIVRKDRIRANNYLRHYVHSQYLPNLGVVFAKTIKILELINEECWTIVHQDYTIRKTRRTSDGTLVETIIPVVMPKLKALQLIKDVALEMVNLKDSTIAVENMDIIIARFDKLRSNLKSLQERLL